MDLVAKVQHAERLAREHLQSLPLETVIDDESLTGVTEEERRQIHFILTRKIATKAVAGEP